MSTHHYIPLLPIPSHSFRIGQTHSESFRRYCKSVNVSRTEGMATVGGNPVLGVPWRVEELITVWHNLRCPRACAYWVSITFRIRKCGVTRHLQYRQASGLAPQKTVLWHHVLRWECPYSHDEDDVEWKSAIVECDVGWEMQ
jgi:hypothetical protein